MRKSKKHKAYDEDTAEEAPATEPSGAFESSPSGEGTAGSSLEELTAERDNLLARLQRVSADYLNYQKRALREIEEARQFAVTGPILALLDVMDDLERAIEHARANHDSGDPLLVGTDLVYKKALDVLKRFSVEHIEALGRAFDPAMHDAILQQPAENVEPMTVISEVQKGYVLKGRTIRPAKVVVAVSPAAEARIDAELPEGGAKQPDGPEVCGDL
ncbi:MAG: nucleotide exchange factor GrpE [Planctomycetes bacterium]|nr:nucleotide exchange factor GrpE [Planctomycetota bacterium]